jgi:hypothetical protein
MNIEEKVERNRKFAEAWKDTYLRAVGAQSGSQEGGTYAKWKFAKDAVLLQPEFCGHDDGTHGITPVRFDMFTTDPTLKGKSESMDMTAKAATMEGTAYAQSFPDWKPVDFQVYPSDRGCAWRTRWEGYTRNATKSDGTKIPDGTKMGFYTFSYIDINDEGEITRWETQNNGEYSDFLDVVVHQRPPFKLKGFEYMAALARTLKEHGIEIKR